LSNIAGHAHLEIHAKLCCSHDVKVKFSSFTWIRRK
jgi:hypothetical protein